MLIVAGCFGKATSGELSAITTSHDSPSNSSCQGPPSQPQNGLVQQCCDMHPHIPVQYICFTLHGPSIHFMDLAAARDDQEVEVTGLI